MKWSAVLNQYIRGEAFSSSLVISYKKEKYPEQTRIDKLLELTKGKRIIHVGCCDHIPLIKDKIERRQWLHALLDENCSECMGVDINQEGIRYLQEQLHYTNTVCGNLITDNILVQKEGNWDFILLGEVLEHIDNPVAFLSEIHRKFTGKVNKIIVTVPNILTRRAAHDIKQKTECINTDHRYWFTPYTISKVVSCAGYKELQLYFANRTRLTACELAVRKIERYFKKTIKYDATYFDTIVVVADLMD